MNLELITPSTSTSPLAGVALPNEDVVGAAQEETFTKEPVEVNTESNEVVASENGQDHAENVAASSEETVPKEPIEVKTDNKAAVASEDDQDHAEDGATASGEETTPKEPIEASIEIKDVKSEDSHDGHAENVLATASIGEEEKIVTKEPIEVNTENKEVQTEDVLQKDVENVATENIEGISGENNQSSSEEEKPINISEVAIALKDPETEDNNAIVEHHSGVPPNMVPPKHNSRVPFLEDQKDCAVGPDQQSAIGQEGPLRSKFDEADTR